MVSTCAPPPGSRRNGRWVYIGKNCTLIETDTSDHAIHNVHADVYLDAVDQLLPQ